jgi:hypothetical protein
MEYLVHRFISFAEHLYWGRFLAEIQDSEAISRKQCFIVEHRLRDLCPKAEPWEQRGLTLYTLAIRLQKEKARFNPYMVIFKFIGYFILVLLTFPSLVLCDLPYLQISQVLSLCCAIPTSLLLSQFSGLVCFLLILLPATLFLLWCSDPSRVKEHHLNLGVYIFIASVHV